MHQEKPTIHKNNRILSIDVMRGVAILGIFFVNIYSFHTPYLYVDPYSLAKSDCDKFIYSLVDIFAQASFYPLFAILFGYGLIILKNRVESRGQSFYPIAIRRLGVLLGFGIIHAFLVWPGDILITYAVLGFFLVAMIQLSAKAQVLIATLLYSIPNILLILLFLLLSFLDPSGMEEVAFNLGAAEQVSAIYQNGSFIDITRQRIEDWSFTNLDGSIILFFTVLPLLLIGSAFSKAALLVPSEKNTKLFKVVLLICLPLGLVLKTIPYWVNKGYPFMLIQDQFGGVTLTFAYIAMIYLISNSKKLYSVLKYMANVGRLSLSNYLFQSIICTLLFYSYGLGLYGKVSYTTSTIMAVIIFLFQILFSAIWLKFYKMGPLEWIWRGFTYGRFPNLKKQAGGVEK